MKAKSVSESLQDVFKPKDKEKIVQIIGIDPEKEIQIEMDYYSDIHSLIKGKNIKIKEYWIGEKHFMILTGRLFDLWNVFYYFYGGSSLKAFKKTIINEAFQDVLKPRDKEKIKELFGRDPDEEAYIRMPYYADDLTWPYGANAKVRKWAYTNPDTGSPWMMIDGKIIELWKAYTYIRGNYSNTLEDFKNKLEFQD